MNETGDRSASYTVCPPARIAPRTTRPKSEIAAPKSAPGHFHLRSERQVDDIELAVAHVAGRVDTIELLGGEGETTGSVTGIVPADQVLGNSLHRIEIERRTRRGRIQIKLVDEIFQHVG